MKMQEEEKVEMRERFGPEAPGCSTLLQGNPQSLLPTRHPHHQVSITSPVWGPWLPQHGGLSARILHLGQPLLHAADVAV
jgi:hypothetical protein